MATSAEVLTSPKQKPAATMSLEKQPKYYEADGALRAQANRNFLLAIGATVIALIAVFVMFFVRIQPPTVIRVLPNGEASVVGPNGSVVVAPNAIKKIRGDEAPTEFEKENYVLTFLDRYLNFDAHTISTNWSYALNMMTGTLRNLNLANYQKYNTVGKFEDEHVRSVFKMSHIEALKEDPMQYTVTGVRMVYRMEGGQQEQVDQIVESYTVRLADYTRSKMNPSGLLISQISENQIHSESKTVTDTGAGPDGAPQ